MPLLIGSLRRERVSGALFLELNAIGETLRFGICRTTIVAGKCEGQQDRTEKGTPHVVQDTGEAYPRSRVLLYCPFPQPAEVTVAFFPSFSRRGKEQNPDTCTKYYTHHESVSRSTPATSSG